MSIHVALNHVTDYRYDRLVTLSPQIVRLRPAPHCRTPILSYSMRVEPASHFTNWQQDPFGNFLARVLFPDTTTEFSVVVDLIAEICAVPNAEICAELSATTCAVVNAETCAVVIAAKSTVSSAATCAVVSLTTCAVVRLGT